MNATQKKLFRELGFNPDDYSPNASKEIWKALKERTKDGQMSEYVARSTIVWLGEKHGRKLVELACECERERFEDRERETE